MSSKLNLVILIAALIGIVKITDVFGGATEEQMWAAGALMRDVCFPKFPKVSKELADEIKAGNLPDEKDAKCYVNCILEMMQTMKKGKFLYESTLKQVDLLMPDDYKDEYKAGAATCKDVANGIKNNCDSAYAIFTCLKKEISRFVFP
uniref:Odorant binding protein 5 n=1 Tax=Delia antiqua TaxID=265456 RepID=D4AHN5_9MUSC|nr:odorant binding protein 5 [Delia antiqua]